MRNLLKEELDYEENVTQFYQIEKMAKSKIIEEKKRQLTVEKISLKFKGYKFGLGKLTWIIIGMFLIFFSTQLTFFFMLRPNAVRAQNLIKLFVLGAETSSSFSSLNVLMLQTVLYNNTLTGWQGKSTLDTFKDISDHIRMTVLDAYIESADLDFGDYEQKFQESLDEVRTQF